MPFHVWKSLVEKARLQDGRRPETWDAFWDFFKPMQAKLRAAGHAQRLCHRPADDHQRPVDGNNTVQHFLIAYGGRGIVTPDGKLHLDDPKVKEAVIKAIDYI